MKNIFYVLPFIFGICLTTGACNDKNIDIYQALTKRLGMNTYDPKLESQKILANCEIEGRPATLGVVTFSYSMMKLAGLNQRGTFGPMYIAARKDSDGTIITMVADASKEDQVSNIKEKWINSWGCRIDESKQ